MAYSVINKTGCCERKGNLQIRFDFYLEEKDPRYQDTYVQVIDTNSKEYLAGYTGKVDKEGNPLIQANYDAWYNSLPKVYQLNPFHSHFAYFDPDVTDEEIKAEMNFHLANFYKAYQDGWDAVQGGMRHGFAVEKRLGCLDYEKLDSKANFKLRKAQVNSRLALLSDIQSKPTSIGGGKSYPATTIDVGSAAIDRGNYFIAGRTLIGLDNPANDTGTLDTVEIWAYDNMTGTNKVGTFYGSSTTYTSRDYETIGSVTAGAKRTFTGLSIDVTTGDFIGIYYSVGYIERDDNGYAGICYASGDKFGTGSQKYSLYANNAISLYATGGTPATAPTITNSTGESNVTATAARLNYNLTDDGGDTTTVTVYWGDNDGGTTAGNWDNSQSLGTKSEGTGYYDVSSLDTGTTYYYRYYASNSAGSDWADSTESFLTKPAAPTNVSATDGTYTDKVVITWTKSTGATGYKIYEGSNLLDTVGDVATYDDTAASAPTITAGSSVASDGTYSSYVALSLSGTSANNGATRTYKVVAVNATGDSADSSTDTGYRGVGTLTYQWQKSAADSDADYSNISGATSSTYNDAAGETYPNGRYYRCVLNATGATQQISAADRGYRLAIVTYFSGKTLRAVTALASFSGKTNREVLHYLRAVRVNIDGESVTIYKGSVNIKTKLEERSTASFKVIDEDASLTFREDMPVEIYDIQQDKIFGGFIDTYSPSDFSDGLLWDINCKDYRYLADKRICAKVYENETSGDIVTDLFDTYLAEEGVTVGQIDTGDTLRHVMFNYVKVSDALDKIAEQNNFIWFIDKDKKLYFVARGAYTAPYEINDMVVIRDSTSLKYASPKYRNQQYIKGSGITDEQLETFTGDGETMSFTCGFPLAKVPIVTEDSYEMTIGIKGIDTDKDYYWSKGDNTLMAAVAPDIGVIVNILYQGQYDFVAISADYNEITKKGSLTYSSGLVEDVDSDVSSETREAAMQMGSNLLRKYINSGSVFAFQVYTKGLQVGQIITVDYPKLKLSGEMLIQDINISCRDDDIRYKVTAITGPEMGSWSSFFASLIKNTAKTDINVGSGASILIVPELVTEDYGWTETVSKAVYACPLCTASATCGEGVIVC